MAELIGPTIGEVLDATTTAVKNRSRRGGGGVLFKEVLFMERLSQYSEVLATELGISPDTIPASIFTHKSAGLRKYIRRQVGALLGQRRADLRLPQARIAQILDISPERVRKMETGSRPYTLY